MRDRIREAAETNNRSMNAEIVARLEMTFAGKTRDALEDQSEAHNAQSEAINATIVRMQEMMANAFVVDAWAMKHGIPTREEALRRLAEIALLYDTLADELENAAYDLHNHHNARVEDVANVLDKHGYESTEFLDASVDALSETLEELERYSVSVSAVTQPARAFREAKTIAGAKSLAAKTSYRLKAQLARIERRQRKEDEVEDE
jgi:hypothetical protein